MAASRQYGTRDKGGVNAVGRERNRAAPGCVWIATVPEEERSSDRRIGPGLCSSGREYVIELILCATGRDWGYDRLDRSPSGYTATAVSTGAERDESQYRE